MPYSTDPPGSSFRIAVRTFGPFETALRREWQQFQRSSGCRLELDLVSLDHHPLYETLFEHDGLRSGQYDVALINTDWLAEAHQRAALADLTPRIAEGPPDDFPAGWAPSLLRLQQFGSQLLGLPYHDGPECLIYRRDLFDDAQHRRAFAARHGCELTVPQTWDEFARVARFFHQPAKRLFGTVFAAYPDGHNTVYDICLQLWSRGGEWFDDQRRLNLNSPQMIDALTFYRQTLNDATMVHPESRTFDSVASGAAFARGEVAMMINWFGFAAVCDTEADSALRGCVQLAPIPCAPGGSPVSLNCYWMLSVAAGSRHAELAYGFVRHCMSAQSDRQRTLDGVIGCRKSTWTDADVNATIPYYHRLEALHEHARELPRHPRWVDASRIIDCMVLAAINTERPVAEIVAETQTQVSGLAIAMD